ncbi:ABC transporter ATP-binding protein [Butyrivibrio fibrisolvens]|jgi:ABC-2 type transport system ATP-binding protein|uniref:ABC-2 type transport system ATP-binding protein n=1 Tax=Butyrivibrio fibrisolvens TaxID=831 RepID=A0A1H9SY54_BUTFI|nr:MULTISPECIES: ATP-binding cassette domain-containing protein [Butyrivibrio]MCR4636437.1 ATP-binding cassette domain-containing protein [Butyrivibrio sp.]SER89875.1 ABC-2 type transport system ATP-binding protein [Butyrivibrio fibrisolvens]
MAFEVKHLQKKFGDKQAVEDLSFELKEPGVYALLGTNGAGKSTSIRMMLGILERDNGEVLFGGENFDTRKVNVGYLAEERGLYPKYPIMDQLLYFASLKGLSADTAMDRIKYWGDRLKVTEYLFPERKKGKKFKPTLADQMSKGNQQKIQLMAALISDPQFLILDEPLSGLDPVNTDLFKSVIREEIARNKYIIMSSHQMPVIEEFCEDITILNRGKAVVSGNLNQIKKSYGRVNLFVKCDEDISDTISTLGIKVVNDTPAGIQLKVKDESEAKSLLKRLSDESRTIVRFELREPSLHEIFIESVGESALDNDQNNADNKAEETISE